MHIPVLANAVLQSFEPSVKCYLDLTLGLGGHASIVSKHFRPSLLFGLDTDADMLKLGTNAVISDLSPQQRFMSFKSNYSDVLSVLPPSARNRVDAVVMDLGVASPHFDDAERGMSFIRDGKLDMRLDRSQSLTAHHVVNSYTESALGRIIQEFGEERHYRACARQIVASRRETPIDTTLDLTNLLAPVLGPRKGASHPATKVFQALRIETNDELGNLRTALPRVIEHVLSQKGGRLTVISFHTLEDRVVKNCFAEAKASGLASFVLKKPIIASPEEVKRNPRSRSAKLRFIVCGQASSGILEG